MSKTTDVISFDSRIILLGFSLCIFALGFTMKSWAASSLDRPVVVELFTSQGCNSCPPAEKFLNKLAERDDVIALEFHVDYWDYIGWKDPFASPEYTKRQRSYAGPLSMRYIYTPQMVINGKRHEVGSREMSVEVAIDEEKNRPSEAMPVLHLNHGENDVNIRVQSNGVNANALYDIILVSYDARHETKVTRGENRGRTLISSNIVRDMRVVGRWTGEDMEFNIPVHELSGDGGCAVLLQERGGGPILAAAMLPLS
ncbi:DUF1223 domain-containing protein [Curvivirga aplysinae]|uniref:DUF1223 domain-containing protein n=1 Tax=Curvivirga aplysinae TaxID=2529852 RepID=UPI0012BC3D02|nr:DUF1223 domain-containing protein [Curvivirga aplysinae]MTI11319.1 DUF1223 domain-containing protein [Curvivirga aplysinae]